MLVMVEEGGVVGLLKGKEAQCQVSGPGVPAHLDSPPAGGGARREKLEESRCRG